MNSLICPRCGAVLLEDAWESLQEKEDGGFLVDAYPAYVCRAKCGYMKMIEPIPEVIAQRGDDCLLLLYPDNQGRILDLRDSLIFPPMHIDALLAKGYWDDYIGNYDVEVLLESVRDSRGAFLETPNLFQFATSELSQDAFLCWLISWSQQAYRSVDGPLHEAAVDFISMIFNIHEIPVPIVETLKVMRQFKSLDVLVIVNNKYAILIEDKTYTKDHSNQLIRYRKAVREAYPSLIQLPIYFKIADQSHYRSVDEAGYILFNRKMMLDVLKKGKDNGVKNPIFLDYYQHLQKLEDRVSAFRTKPVKEWDEFAWQGFYKELQTEIKGDWGYVSNPSGGFWAFWWGSTYSNRYYLQLEQLRLCVKITAKEDENKQELRTMAMKEVLLEAEKRNLSLQKPAIMRNGKTMTIAQRQDYIQTNDDGTVDMQRTILELKKY
ncbi:PD-(D/E)XK nuclease family protein [Bacillus sp. RG28]|uniref:PD-(D/E)XK nuclease family protein n=1 Tax=Gottfriedia endophytica TaxID=2820819 RepID=A0A940NJA6_9BACI|nr:PD-(D/E)XK nuclease family protein [Gottfriedia endophytica]MBP0725157.1 PD-(D/E)XK nuclease family protein [Gottfriedia endophytica]